MIKKALILIGFVTVSFLSYAQDNIFTSNDIFKMKSIGEIAISPDGKALAYSVNTSRPFSDKPGSSYKELFVLDLTNGKTKSHYNGKKSFYSISWSPDSKDITFLAKWFKSKTTQVYKFNLETDSAIQVTNSQTSISSYQWNPNNGSIAYISTVKDTSRNKLKKKRFNAEIYEEEIPQKNLYLYDLNSTTVSLLTNGVAAQNMEWNPEGTLIAVQVCEKNLIDYSYMFKKIQIINPKTRETTLLVNTPGKLGKMAWAPDGKHLAFISGIDINDPVNGSLFISQVPNKKDFTQLIN